MLDFEKLVADHFICVREGATTVLPHVVTICIMVMLEPSDYSHILSSRGNFYTGVTVSITSRRPELVDLLP